MKENTDNPGGVAAFNEVPQKVEIVNLPRAVLRRSVTNPRKKFKALDELCDSIIAEGIISPLIVRPMKGEPNAFEIGAGERRERAHGMALEKLAKMLDAETDAASRAALERKLEAIREVPAIVRELDDARFCALQLVENLQRNDLTPLEEADSYKAALDLRHEASGELIYTVETLAAELGRNPVEIRKALKWFRLPVLAREAFELELLTRDIATVIGRIPGEVERRLATLETIFFPHDKLAEGDLKEREAQARAMLKDEPGAVQPMSMRLAREHIKTHYMSTLKGAPFDLADASLVPVVMGEDGEGGTRLRGGACADCPHMVGNNLLFSGEIAKAGVGGSRYEQRRGRRDESGAGLDPLTCCNPACKREKLMAFSEKENAAILASGATRLEDDEARDVFADYPPFPVRPGSPWVDVADVPGFELVGHVAKNKLHAWSHYIKETSVPVRFTLDAGGSLRRLVDREAAIAAINLHCLTSGEKSPFEHADKAEHRPLKMEPSLLQGAEQSELVKKMEEMRIDAKKSAAAEKKKEKQAKAQNDLARVLGLEILIETVAKRGALGLDDLWFILEKMILQNMGIDGLRGFALLLDIKPEDAAKKLVVDNAAFSSAIIKHLRKIGAPKPALEGWIVAGIVGAALRYEESFDGYLKKVAAHFGAPIQEARERAKARLAEKSKPAKSAGESKAKKGKLTTTTRSASARRNQAAVANEEAEKTAKSSKSAESAAEPAAKPAKASKPAAKPAKASKPAAKPAKA